MSESPRNDRVATPTPESRGATRRAIEGLLGTGARGESRFGAVEPRAGEALDEIVAMLLEENGDDRMAALVVAYFELASMLGVDSAPDVLLDLASAGSRVVRARALLALGAIGDDRSIGALAAVLRRGTAGDPETLLAAVEAAGLTRSALLARLLEERLDSNDPAVASHAESIVRALGSIGDPGSRQALRDAAEESFLPPRARAEARAALERLEILDSPDRGERLRSLVERVWVSGSDFRSDFWALAWMVRDGRSDLAAALRRIYEGRKHRLSSDGAWSERAVYLDALRRLGDSLSAEEIGFLRQRGRVR